MPKLQYYQCYNHNSKVSIDIDKLAINMYTQVNVNKFIQASNTNWPDNKQLTSQQKLNTKIYTYLINEKKKNSTLQTLKYLIMGRESKEGCCKWTPSAARNNNESQNPLWCQKLMSASLHKDCKRIFRRMTLSLYSGSVTRDDLLKIWPIMIFFVFPQENKKFAKENIVVPISPIHLVRSHKTLLPICKKQMSLLDGKLISSGESSLCIKWHWKVASR